MYDPRLIHEIEHREGKNSTRPNSLMPADSILSLPGYSVLILFMVPPIIALHDGNRRRGLTTWLPPFLLLWKSNP